MKDLALILHILHPAEGLEKGLIKLIVDRQVEGPEQHEVPVTGPCDDATLEKVFHEILSYYRTGHKSFTNRLNGHDNGEDKGFKR